MSISFLEFIDSLQHNPMLVIITLLMFGSMIVNGWTDAPNAIATCVSTRSIRTKRAIALAVLCNFLGVLIMTLFNTRVAKTVFLMIDFGSNQEEALIALCAGLVAFIIWALAAWKFGIPTSESHALIAGLSGSVIALHKGFDGINESEWSKVLYGFVLCMIFCFLSGWFIVKLTERFCRHRDRRVTQQFFKGGSIFGGAMMAFMHGAQSGQKFIGVFLIGIFMANGTNDATNLQIPIWLMLLCSVALGIGTCIGGYKIIKSVGMDLVKLEKYQGFCADTAASICLLGFSLTGIPVSTSHAKLTSIMGVGTAKRVSSLDWKFVRRMLLVWVLTFPCAGFIAFVITNLFMLLF